MVFKPCFIFICIKLLIVFSVDVYGADNVNDKTELNPIPQAHQFISEHKGRLYGMAGLVRHQLGCIWARLGPSG